MLLFKSIIALLFLPGMVSGLIPFVIGRYDPWLFPGWNGGWILILPGIAILLHSIWAFYRCGEGTLAHWSPPIRLVNVGLFRYTRNPMYNGVILIILGQIAISGSMLLTMYLVFVVFSFNLHIRLVEEPWLAENFPEQWRDYSRTTPRWGIKRRP